VGSKDRRGKYGGGEWLTEAIDNASRKQNNTPSSNTYKVDAAAIIDLIFWNNKIVIGRAYDTFFTTIQLCPMSIGFHHQRYSTERPAWVHLLCVPQ